MPVKACPGWEAGAAPGGAFDSPL